MVVVKDGHKYKTHREQTAGLVEAKNKWIKKRATQIKFGITILTPQGSVKERNVEQKNSNSLGTYC